MAGRKAVSLDVVTTVDERIDFTPLASSLHPEVLSKEMSDEIFCRFPRLKFIRCGADSVGICSVVISSFLETYQVRTTL